MTDVLHQPAWPKKNLVAREKQEWAHRIALQAWRRSEPLILRGRTLRVSWKEGLASEQVDNYLVGPIYHHTNPG